MKAKLLTLTTTLFFCCNLFGQFSIPIQPWANDVENRTLVVQLKEEDPKEVEKLQKKGLEEVEQYKNSVKEFNQRIQNLIPLYWPFKTKIEFKSKADVDLLNKTKDEHHMILRCRWAEEIKQNGRTYYKYNVYTMLLYFPEYGNSIFDYNSIDNNDGDRSPFLRRGQYIFKISMPDYFINKRDVKFAMQQFKEYIERAKTEGWPKKMSSQGFKIAECNTEKAKSLTKKTLLIPEEILTVDPKNVEQTYKASFQVVSFAKTDSLLTYDSKGEYAYYQIVWSDQLRNWTLVILDNLTGEILAENPTWDKKFVFSIAGPLIKGQPESTVTFFKTADANFVINEKHLSRLSEQIFSK